MPLIWRLIMRPMRLAELRRNSLRFARGFSSVSPLYDDDTGNPGRITRRFFATTNARLIGIFGGFNCNLKAR